MWENDIDEHLIESFLCQECDDMQQRRFMPCGIHPALCPHPLNSSELLQKILNLQKGKNQCQRHLLHENRYLCSTCNTGKPICLICFAEDHIGHVITETYPNNIAHRRQYLDDVGEKCGERALISKDKRRKLGEHQLESSEPSPTFVDRLKGVGLIPLLAQENIRKVRTKKEGETHENSVSNEVKNLTSEKPSVSRKTESKHDVNREKIWLDHYFALISYGEDNKCGERPNYNLPENYIFNEGGSDELQLGQWVYKLNFKCMSDDFYMMISDLIDYGDFDILFEKDGQGRIRRASSKNTSSSSSSSSSSGSSRKRLEDDNRQKNAGSGTLRKGSPNNSIEACQKANTLNNLQELQQQFQERALKIKEEPRSNDRESAPEISSVKVTYAANDQTSTSQNRLATLSDVDRQKEILKSLNKNGSNGSNHINSSMNSNQSNSFEDADIRGNDDDQNSLMSRSEGDKSSNSNGNINLQNKKETIKKDFPHYSYLLPNTCILHKMMCLNSGRHVLSFSVISSDSIIDPEDYSSKTCIRAYLLTRIGHGKIQNCFFQLKTEQILVQAKDIYLCKLSFAKGKNYKI